MATIRSLSSHRVTSLEHCFEVAVAEPGAIQNLTELDTRKLTFRPALVPGTAAAIEGLLGSTENPDNVDIWYRGAFAASDRNSRASYLRFGGLATLADVWLNGSLVLSSDNMFHEHELDVSKLLESNNSLVMRFRSVDAELKRRKGRPRWRTRLVNNQKLCQLRTTLLGRIPGWTPALPAVGPWKPITLEQRSELSIERADVRCRLEDGHGLVTAILQVRELGTALLSAKLVVGEYEAPLSIRSLDNQRLELHAELRIPAVKRWWPHTHGEPARYPARIELIFDSTEVKLELNELAFRTIEVSTANSGFELFVNETPIFCRGASWTTLDAKKLCVAADAYLAALDQVRDAGMNMLRASGTMFYESDAFYEACDARGVLVWQDFMFANMDYPTANADFLRSVELEARQLLTRLQARPCIAVLCGGSEVHQQAAMLGLPRDAWQSPLFDELLPGLTREILGDVPYVPSTPYGGTLPFRTNAGVCHYFGVGAYLRPLEDSRRADVRFAAESLAFSNVPEPETVDLLLPDGQAPFHHPLWKAAVPRDSGSGWDFEDVRDHYVKELFGADVLSVRYADSERYLALGRVATGEMMQRTFSEWRRSASTCKGALIWFLRDLVPGAGFGVIDATGLPKSVYYYLKRALKPLTLLLTDEGLNGLALHVVNDTPRDFSGTLRLCVYRGGRTKVSEGSLHVVARAHSQLTLSSDDLLQEFLDVTYAYRFGPPPGELIVASLSAESGIVIAEAFHFPIGYSSAIDPELQVEAQATFNGLSCELSLRSERFAQAVAVSAAGYIASDNYFHLAPGSERVVSLRPSEPQAKLRPTRPPSLTVRPLNSALLARVPVSFVDDSRSEHNK